MKKVALITGGTRGIGLGIARSLARENYRLALNGVRPKEAAQEALDEIRSLGTDVIYCQADIADRANHATILDEIGAQFGALHLLVNYAGIAPL
jgi:3-oxoacyl-[acyl-carrier protein] reductase